MRPTIMRSATTAWLATLGAVLNGGAEAAPRGLRTKELLHHTLAFSMRRPVVRSQARRLSYRFLAGEALWILSGSNRVDEIAPYNSRIAAFSDDGATFFGAYGPRISDQFSHVLGALIGDRDTRQAVLTIWRENPPPTKDVPCTVALTFNIRGGQLNCHAFMRSSDAWLGLPYDVFNFSMIATRFACAYNLLRPIVERVALGALYLTAVSSHLYEPNWEGAVACMQEGVSMVDDPAPLDDLVRQGDFETIERDLIACRDDTRPRVLKIREKKEP